MTGAPQPAASARLRSAATWIVAAVAGVALAAVQTVLSTRKPDATPTPAGPAAPAPAAPAAPTRSAVEAQADAGIDQYRSVAKWMITAFAAVASLLLAGVQLTSIGHTTGGRLALAAIGIAVALAATMIAIYSLTLVFKPGVVGPDDAAARADDASTPFGKFVAAHRSALLPAGTTSGQDLYDKYTAARTAAASPNGTEQDKATARRYRARLADLAWFARLIEVESTFKTARIRVCIAAAVVAAGITTFAWAANPKDSSDTDTTAAAVNARPVQVRVLLNPDGRRHLATLLGRPCAAAAGVAPGIDALATAASADTTTLIVIPGGPCTKPVLFTLSISDGAATSTESVTPAASPVAG
jgi:hypothetical protein